MRRIDKLSMGIVAMLSASATPAVADTTDVQWQNRVVIAKQGAHCVDDPNCFNRYHPAIPPTARAKPGDMVVFHTRDALDFDLTLDFNADDMAALDLNLIHPMTGPVFVEGAERGDVLAVTLVDIEPDQDRLHGDRAGVRLPARHIHRAVSGELAVVAHPRGIRPDAGGSRFPTRRSWGRSACSPATRR